jgi:hypothetical protein
MNMPMNMPMTMNDCRLILFAKAPVPGQVKTRLIPAVGPSAAATLYEQLILHSLSIATDAQIGPVDLWCAPSTEHPFFLRCSERFPISLFSQPNGDLGSRMAHAFRDTLTKTSLVLLMGTDCPSLTADDLREGASVLRRGIAAVIGPSEDGGYVLIGLRRYAPELFTGISWGTGYVLHQTRQRLRGLGWKWHELSEQWDVDRPEDMERLNREGYLRKPSHE